MVRLSDPVHSSATHEYFGEVFDDKAHKVPLHALFEQPTHWLEQRLSVTAAITKVCQKKGCFFIIQYQGQPLRVAFKDYGFFIPSDAGGKTVTFTGQLIRHHRSAAAAAHFNADVGPNETSIAAGDTYEFIADAVMIPR